MVLALVVVVVAVGVVAVSVIVVRVLVVVIVVTVVTVDVVLVQLAADSLPVKLAGTNVLAGHRHEMVDPATWSSNPAGHAQLAVGPIDCPPLWLEHASTLAGLPSLRYCLHQCAPHRCTREGTRTTAGAHVSSGHSPTWHRHLLHLAAAGKGRGPPADQRCRTVLAARAMRAGGSVRQTAK